MTRQQITTISFLALLFGCGSNGATTCAPETEHSHEGADDEEESCEPGKNCMCPGGSIGTSVCDVATEKFLECDCSKGATAAAGAATGSTTSAATGAAGMTVVGAAGSGTTVAAAGGNAGAAAGHGAAGAAGH